MSMLKVSPKSEPKSDDSTNSSENESATKNANITIFSHVKRENSSESSAASSSSQVEANLRLSNSSNSVLSVENRCVTDRSSEDDNTQRSTRSACQSTSETPKAGSWEEAYNSKIIPIRCKEISAELHKKRFGSGGRGRCIRYNETWYTPNEFEALCGRASSKDWKRSIRHGGRSISTLIQEGVLVLHATSCTCSVCCDDEAATGPVRLFTPYKRKLRSFHSDRQVKIQKTSEADSESDTALNSSSSSLNTSSSGQTLNSQLNSNSRLNKTGILSSAASLRVKEWQNVSNKTDVRKSSSIQQSEQARPSNIESPMGIMESLDNISKNITRLAAEMIKCVEAGKVLGARALKIPLPSDKPQPLVVNLVNSQKKNVDASKKTPSRRCVNCNRDSSAECSLCRRTSYCSTFCQRRDWPQHRLVCQRATHGPRGPTVPCDNNKK